MMTNYIEIATEGGRKSIDRDLISTIEEDRRGYTILTIETATKPVTHVGFTKMAEVSNQETEQEEDDEEEHLDIFGYNFHKEQRKIKFRNNED